MNIISSGHDHESSSIDHPASTLPPTSSTQSNNSQSAISSAVTSSLFDSNHPQADQIEDHAEDDDSNSYRPFSLRSIPPVSSSQDEDDQTLDALKSPTTPPQSLLVAQQFSPADLSPSVTTPRAERALTGHLPSLKASDTASDGSSHMRHFTSKSSSSPQPQQPQQPTASLRKDSTTSTVWRASLASEHPATDLASVTFENEHLFSEPDSDLEKLQNHFPHSSRGSDDADLLLAASVTSDTQVNSSLNPTARTVTGQFHESENFDEPKTRAPPPHDSQSHSQTLSPLRSPVTLFTSPVVNAQSSPHGPHSRRQSILEGRTKLRESFARVQGEMIASSRNSSSPSGQPLAEPTTTLHSPLFSPRSYPRSPETKAALATLEQQISQIDWDFWGAVMNDYETVAKEQPKQLSRAIQSGIPPVLRGMMWQ